MDAVASRGDGPVRVLYLALLVVLVPACAPPGEGGEPVPPPDEPTLATGTPEPGTASNAAEGLRVARTALAEGRHRRALDEARRIVEGYPRTPASVPALRIAAEAAFALEEWSAAAADAERYAGVEGIGAGARTELRLLAARALAHAERPDEALRTLARLPVDAPSTVAEGALELARRLAPAVARASIRELARTLSPSHPAAPPLFVEVALDRYVAGDEEGARGIARALLSGTPPDREARIARAVIEGRAEEVASREARLGAILPRSGPRYLRRYGDLLEEGIRLALEREVEELERPVSLEVAGGEAPDTVPGGAPGEVDAIATLESRGTLGVVGPLTGEGFGAVVDARRRGTPVVSPTAREVPADARGAYALLEPDSVAAVVLADAARRLRFDRVAVVYPRIGRWEAEAEAFMRAFRDAGGVVVLDAPYDSATTTFTAPLRRVAALEPHAVFLPVPREDVPLVAPQLAFFGLDTLGIRVLGSDPWAAPEVLRTVDARYLDGVVAATAVVPGDEGGPRARFVEAYEERYRKSLQSELPALGYDAAGLLLHALRNSNARTPGQLRRALDEVAAYPGVTGTLRVEDGHVIRERAVVILRDGRAVPLRLPPHPGMNP